MFDSTVRFACLVIFSPQRKRKLSLNSILCKHLLCSLCTIGCTNVRTNAVGLSTLLAAWFDTLTLTYEMIMWSPGRTGCHGFLQVLPSLLHMKSTNTKTSVTMRMNCISCNWIIVFVIIVKWIKYNVHILWALSQLKC